MLKRTFSTLMEKTEKEVLGWTRDKKGKIVNRHKVDIANCVTSSKRDNTQNYVKEVYFLNGSGEVASTLTTGHDRAMNIIAPKGGHKQMGVLEVDGELFRIRKLTERECFRLMGVADKDIDVIKQSGISKTQLYKLAGNSIVVDCLFHIFHKMFVETKGSGQLNLF